MTVCVGVLARVRPVFMIRLKWSMTLLCPLIVMLSASACSTRGSKLTLTTDEAHQIERVLQEQDEAWNKGDIDGFMRAYWHSPELSFSAGGKLVRGWEGIRERYKTRYPDRSAMGTLSFSDLEIMSLGRNHVLVLGRWRVAAQSVSQGAFSLVMRRDHEQWLIIHDHTSLDSP